MPGMRETFYLWFLNGQVITSAGRVLGEFDSVDDAALSFPTATFRVSARSLDNLR